MTTPVGQISLNDVNVELDLPGTSLITMNDSNVRTLAGVGGSGTIISMSNLQGKSNRVAIALTISSPVANYDIYSNRGPTYDPGKSDITLTIAAPAVVYSSSTGSSSLVVPSAFNPADTVTIVNNGVILGRGGNGGNGNRGYDNVGGTNGSSGGPALSVSRPTSINNVNRIAGGGGGGGGGAGAYYPGDPSPSSLGGGGGGGGIGNGSGGAGGPSFYTPVSPNNIPGDPGNAGTLTSAGTGGSGHASPAYGNGNGGPGGGYGSSGSPGNDQGNASGSPPRYKLGGAAGAAVSGNPYITWINTGTRNGSIS